MHIVALRLTNRGKCPGSYVREEALGAEFARAIRQLAFTDEFLEQAKEALRQSQAAQRQEREEVVARLQAEKTKLQRRIEAMYEDKLDGVIEEAFFARKAAEAKAEQAQLAEQIAQHQQAGVTHIGNLRHLADQAATLFEQQPAHEKRKLLRFVVEKCEWTNGHLTYRWKPPFDSVVDQQMQEQRAA
jgi:hypothetical protein